ncbi:MAG: methyl-accepting chemotaxis protein [Chloroflexi bacterium]|nr:methyl-accepting chemotaxis protein [Chloroflexota bacterium]
MSITASIKLGFFRSVKGQIFAFFLALSLIPLAVTGGIVFYQSQQVIRADIEKEFNTMGDLQTMEITNWLAERQKDTLTLAGIARIQTMDAEKACPAVLQYFEQWKTYQDIFIARPDGSLLCDVIGDTDSVADQAYFQEAAKGNFVSSDALASKVTGAPFLVSATPILVSGKIVGVIGLTVPTDYLSNLLKTYQTGRTREAYLLGRDGAFITESRFTDQLIETGVIKDRSALELKIITFGSDKGLKGKAGISEYVGYNGNIVLGVYRPIPTLGSGAVLMLEQDLTEVQQASTNLRNSILLVALVSAVFVVGLAILFGRTLTNPLVLISEMINTLALGNLEQEAARDEIIKLNQRRDEYGLISLALDNLKKYLVFVAETAGQITRGDLTATVELRSEKDEIGESLRQMIVGLRQLIGGVKENAARLEIAANSLETTSVQAGTAAGQIATTIQQVALGINQQTEAVSKTATSANQMAHTISNVARGAQEQSVAVEKASNITTRISTAIQHVAASAQSSTEGASQAAGTARSGAKTVEETIQNMQSIRIKVGISAEKVQQMGQRSDQIGAIVETIADIASQTNLLALNAAIEAARAGEQGKGFAVVADEVRKLAERSSNATKEIGGLIKGIQNIVKDAVSAMNDGAKEVENGVIRANQSGEALRSILTAVEVVSHQVDEIASAARQINTSSNELVAAMDSVSNVVQENNHATKEMSNNSNIVAQAVESIASVSEENSAAVEEVSASTEEMSAQAEDVSASAQALTRLARALQETVTQFKLEK